MIPGNDKNVGSKSPNWRHFIYGGLSSCIAEAGTFPLDTAKSRLQIQGQQGQHIISAGISPSKKNYKGLIDAFLRIPKEEGLRTLYRGLSPALLRQSIYGTIKFGIYYSLKKALTEEENVGTNIILAVLSGIIGSAIANPTDVLKVRMQVSSNKTPLIPLFTSIYKNDGIKGLWRGVGPTSQRAGIIAGVELPVYDFCKSYFIKKDIMINSTPNHLISSFIAAFVTCIASTPIDVIRTRMMSQNLSMKKVTALENGKSLVYKNSLDCLITTLRHENVLALWKGFIPAFVRMGPWNIIFFSTYEQFLKVF